MSLRSPVRVGSEEHEAPTISWEVYVEVELSPRLNPAQIALLKEALWERLNAAVRRTLGPHLVAPSHADVADVRGLGPEAPVFPMVAGEARFTCDQDVGEMIEFACQGTPLTEIAFDARGKAYELDAAPIYLRRPAMDGERVAPMPDPAEFEAMERGRAEDVSARREPAGGAAGAESRKRRSGGREVSGRRRQGGEGAADDS